jgi:hypothetical protein
MKVFEGASVPKLAKKFFRMWDTPEVTDTTFPFIPVRSWRPLQVGAPGSCPGDQPLNPPG